MKGNLYTQNAPGSDEVLEYYVSKALSMEIIAQKEKKVAQPITSITYNKRMGAYFNYLNLISVLDLTKW